MRLQPLTGRLPEPLATRLKNVICPPRQMAGWPLAALRLEESPGSTEIRCRITSGGGDPRESATENKPLIGLGRSKGETVRQERTARTATDAAGQAPPGARPNRDGAGLFPG